MQVIVKFSHMPISFPSFPARNCTLSAKLWVCLSPGESETMAYYSKYTLSWEPSQEKIKKAGDIQILRGSWESIYKWYFWLSDSIFDHMNIMRNN